LMYSQSVADLPAAPDNMSQSLVFVKALPKGAELPGYSGQYLLVVDEMSPKFKFEGQRSVDDDRLQLANLRYFDQKGDSYDVYIPPNLDLVSMTETTLLTSGLDDLHFISVDVNDEKSIEVKAEEVSKNKFPVLAVNETSSYLYGNLHGHWKLRRIIQTHELIQSGIARGTYKLLEAEMRKDILSFTIENLVTNKKIKGTIAASVLISKRINTDPVYCNVKVLDGYLSVILSSITDQVLPLPRHLLNGTVLPRNDERFADLYQGIREAKVHFGGLNGNIYSETSLKADLRQQLFTERKGELSPLEDEKCQLIWLQSLPNSGSEYKNCMILEGSEKRPIVKIKGQRDPRSPGVLCSNLYYVLNNTLKRVRVHISRAKAFNKTLDQIVKKSGNWTSIKLTAKQAQELINRGNLNDKADNQAGCLIPLSDGLLKLLHGGNRPADIEEIRIKETRTPALDPESPPMLRDGGDTASVVSGLETKIEIKSRDSGLTEKDKIARSRTSAFSDEPSEPVLISQSNFEQKALINHVNDGRGLYRPLPSENDTEKLKLVNVDEELDSVDLNF
jgi:hypothetical protein